MHFRHQANRLGKRMSRKHNSVTVLNWMSYGEHERTKCHNMRFVLYRLPLQRRLSAKLRQRRGRYVSSCDVVANRTSYAPDDIVHPLLKHLCISLCSLTIYAWLTVTEIPILFLFAFYYTPLVTITELRYFPLHSCFLLLLRCILFLTIVLLVGLILHYFCPNTSSSFCESWWNTYTTGEKSLLPVFLCRSKV